MTGTPEDPNPNVPHITEQIYEVVNRLTELTASHHWLVSAPAGFRHAHMSGWILEVAERLEQILPYFEASLDNARMGGAGFWAVDMPPSAAYTEHFEGLLHDILNTGMDFMSGAYQWLDDPEEWGPLQAGGDRFLDALYRFYPGLYEAVFERRRDERPLEWKINFEI